MPCSRLGNAHRRTGQGYRKYSRANCSRLGHVHSQTHRSGLGNHGRVACSRKPSHKGYLLSTTTRRKPRLRRQGLQSSRVKWPSIFSPKNNLATSRKVNFPSEGCERQAKMTLRTKVLPGHIFDLLHVSSTTIRVCVVLSRAIYLCTFSCSAFIKNRGTSFEFRSAISASSKVYM